MSESAYAQYKLEIDQWHEKRLADLKTEDGWLNLVGLLWLDQGINSFGSDDGNKIIFPTDQLPAQAGYFIVNGRQVSIKVNSGVTIMEGDRLVKEQVIFHADSGKSKVLTCGSLSWTIIRRDHKVGVRLRDLNSDALVSFPGVKRFQVDPDFRIEARFEASADSTHTINITNALGQTTAQVSPGALVFDIDGSTCRLDVLKGNMLEYFIVFADETTGHDTYDGGRFIYVAKPLSENKVVIDFNKAYNPPCVFTPYATCPLPPEKNVLKVAITAGEKNYHASL